MTEPQSKPGPGRLRIRDRISLQGVRPPVSFFMDWVDHFNSSLAYSAIAPSLQKGPEINAKDYRPEEGGLVD